MLLKSNIDPETGQVRVYIPRDLAAAENGQNSTQPETEMLTPEEVQQRCETSFHEGRQQGEQAGFKKGTESIQTHIETFAKLMKELQAQRSDLLLQSEEFVVEFIFRILRKILGEEGVTTAKIEPEVLHQIVKQALNEFTNSSRFIIRVHKTVAEVFDDYEIRIRETLPGSIELKVIADPSLTPADCLIETDEGVLDARLQSQLNEIQRILKTLPTENADRTEIQ